MSEYECPECNTSLSSIMYLVTQRKSSHTIVYRSGYCFPECVGEAVTHATMDSLNICHRLYITYIFRSKVAF